MIEIPNRYPFAEKVPDEGASCANCKFLGDDGRSCKNKLYIARHGSRNLGALAKHWCCMVWTPEGGRP